MNIGVLGSGMVGQTIAAKLIELGHSVAISTRTPEKLADWQGKQSGPVQIAGVAETAAHGEILFNCLRGTESLDGLQAAGAENLNGKILIDISNPLDFSHGMPPSLTVCNTDSLGEQIQRAFPAAKVVKTLNTVTAALMVNPGLLPGDHVIFVSGNDTGAKATVTDILKNWFGWRAVVDLGDITTARGVEMMLPLWVRLFGNYQTPLFNFAIVK